MPAGLLAVAKRDAQTGVRTGAMFAAASAACRRGAEVLESKANSRIGFERNVRRQLAHRWHTSGEALFLPDEPDTSPESRVDAP